MPCRDCEFVTDDYISVHGVIPVTILVLFEVVLTAAKVKNVDSAYLQIMPPRVALGTWRDNPRHYLLSCVAQSDLPK